MFTGMRSITTLPHNLKSGINFPIRFRETRGAQFKLNCAPRLFLPHPQLKAFDDEARNGHIVLGSEGRDLGFCSSLTQKVMHLPFLRVLVESPLLF